MSVYFGATELTKIDCLVPSDGRDITDVYFGEQPVYTVWDEYSGALPAQFDANGSDMADYRIYGAAGGVGDATAAGEPAGYKLPVSVGNGSTSSTTNVYIGAPALIENEYVDYKAGKIFRRAVNHFDRSASTSSKYINLTNGSLQNSANSDTSGWIAVERGKSYWLQFSVNGTPMSSAQRELAFYNANKVMILQAYIIFDITHDSAFFVDIPQNCAYIRFDYDKTLADIGFYEGGYTDPPAALSPLPTVEGHTAVGYAGAGQTVPGRFYGKYRKENY